MPLVESSVEHLNAIARLLRDFQADGLSLYEHHYEAEACRSFVVVLGTARRRVRFKWSERESVLEVACQTRTDQDDPAPWQCDALISVPHGEDVYAEIASEVSSLLL